MLAPTPKAVRHERVELEELPGPSTAIEVAIFDAEIHGDDVLDLQWALVGAPPTSMVENHLAVADDLAVAPSAVSASTCRSRHSVSSPNDGARPAGRVFALSCSRRWPTVTSWRRAGAGSVVGWVATNLSSVSDREAYVEAVLAIVERIPWGRVTTYGAIADALFDEFGGGPRQVGRVMATDGSGMPWWRVVRANGSLPASHGEEARQAYLEEGTPLRASGAVDLRTALWLP